LLLRSWNQKLPGPTANSHSWCPRTAAGAAAGRTSTSAEWPQTLP